MALLSLSKVKKVYHEREVLRDVSFDLEKGDKAGLVGTNGSGKTTVFRIITGDIEPDGGSVIKPKVLSTGYMPQVVDFKSKQTLRSYVLQGRGGVQQIQEEMRYLEERIQRDPADKSSVHRLGELHEKFHQEGGYRMVPECERILAGLGFSQTQREMPIRALSGGERTKAALARILLQSPDLLLLDEPTNHLDIWASVWLENYLVRCPASVIVVSHDRYFLDRVAGNIVELSGGRTVSYRGNYSSYIELREKHRVEQARKYRKQQAHIAKEEDFIRRYHYGQRAKEARGRAKKLERVERVEKVQSGRRLKVRLESARDKARKIVRLKGVSKDFGGKELFRDVDLEMERGSCVGLIGPNGSGKTTLLRILTGRESPTEGTVERGKVSAGYYDQHQSLMDESNTVLDELASVRPDMKVGELRTEAGRFLFSGEEVTKRVGSLSGGEKARLALACLVISRPSFLVLDEPTNHLDIPSREAVESALSGFDGTVLLVTHDRYLLDALVDKLLVIEDRRVRTFPGDYTFYRNTVEREEAGRKEKERRDRQPDAPGESERFRREQKERERRERQRRRRIEKVHDRIEALELRQKEVMEEFECPEVYEDPGRVKELQCEARRLGDELEEAYKEWEGLESEGGEG